MNALNYEQVNIVLNNILKSVFKEYEYNDLTSFERRKIIYDYLSNNIKYDYVLLDKIKAYHNEGVRISRNPVSEISDVLYEKKGICNSISQVYKMLLNKIGIYSMCICCSDGSSVPHQLNLVFDKNSKTFSFDDVTSKIVYKKDFFNYDLNIANQLGQGIDFISDGKKWIAIPSSYVFYLVGYNDNPTQYDYIEDDKNIIKLFNYIKVYDEQINKTI